MDLVKKKTIALTPEVHADLMRVVGAIAVKTGKNATANDATRMLLEWWASSENLKQKEEAYNFLCNIEAFAKTLGEAGHLHGKALVIIPLYLERRFEIFTPSYIVESSPDTWELAGSFDLPKNETK